MKTAHLPNHAAEALILSMQNDAFILCCNSMLFALDQHCKPMSRQCTVYRCAGSRHRQHFSELYGV